MERPNSRRLERLQATVASHSCDWMLVMDVNNIRYLTGFTGSAGVLVVQPDQAALYVDGRYAEQAEKQVRGARAVFAERPVLPFALRENHPGTTRVGFEANNLTYGDFEALCELLPGVELAGLTKVVEALRAIKDREELVQIRRSCAIVDDVFVSFCSWLEPDMVENQVAARLEYEQRMLGGERGASRDTIVSSGWRTSLPHGAATDKVIEDNQPVMIDIGTVVGGYCSDLTRTVFLGKAPDRFKDIYQSVYDAQQCALDGIKAGMTASEADALAREIIDATGYGHTFDHSLGHSLGLVIHERPFLNPRDDTVLEENMVFTVEPGIYIPDWGGVRIEDMVRVTATGCEMLTHCTRELVEIG